ncbi:DUF2721 domain-containing protein [Methylobacterium oryzihabitans]|uniref:DUF2721 domain-containing protein n=1 Tax=Methylobacterium oryzihabitans TaxID=2499852 RepID=A0A3S2WFI4_9HYPH|nr:DUF2721 domain-containing protein [Methylobacterium oryzihabitans]RVU21121.1 DUF2721 domain-containing protein [Methylobacterium oryzihabitans]
MPIPEPSALDSTAHIIQVALTPVFLLSGIATLLNVFSTRHGRIADQVEKLSDLAADDPVRVLRLADLRRRSLALDVAVVIAALGGIAICGAVLTLFVGALRDAAVASILFFLFGAAIVCTLGSLFAFAVEMTLASRDVRVSVARREAEGAS